MVIVKRKQLSLAERWYLPEIARALSHSLRAIFKPKIGLLSDDGKSED